MSLILITNIIATWQRSAWAAFHGHLATMTAYELQEAASMLHSIARSMEVRKQELIEQTKQDGAS